jgi:Ricin-type beta-trefoil lectin domain/Domain of unknown function (DUF4157)
LFNGLLQGVALHPGGAQAITLTNVVVFKQSATTYNINMWAHEMFHVRQYHEMGLAEFAATYTLSYKSIEAPAYDFGSYFSQSRRSNVITSELLIGHGGKCMARSGDSLGSELRLARCGPTEWLQQWDLSRSGELRVPGATICVDVPSGVGANRIRPSLAQCNGSGRQRFTFTRRGELRSRLPGSLCLEVAGGVVSDGTPLQMYQCNETQSQVWINPTTKLISSTAVPQRDGCLRAERGEFGSPVRLGPCRKADPLQAWANENHGGKLRLVAVPDSCLQVVGFSKAAGAQLQIARCTEQRNQEFMITSRREIRSDVSNNVCLAIAPPGGVVTAQCSNSRAQRWD